MRIVAASLLTSLLLPLTSCTVGNSVSTPEKNRDRISQASFCDAYVLRDANKRDHRPSPEEEKAFPFMKGSHPGNSILGTGGAIVDVAAVGSRVTAQARVSQKQISRLTTALYKTDSFHPMAACYSPHHAFVFYTKEGKPLFCIEICFHCNQVKTLPQLRTRISEPGQAGIEGADLVAMAKIFEELNLPLTPYKSLDALKEDKTEWSKKRRIFLLKYAEEKERALKEKHAQ